MVPSGGGGGGGGIAARRAKLSPSAAPGYGEDRLSALPDDVLVLILLRLVNTAEAVRTSVLSRRWRRIWALLPELRFHFVADGRRIREVLAAPDATPPLRYIFVLSRDSATDSLGAWLPDAARRLSGFLIYHNMRQGNEEEEEEAGGRDAVQLPCFENATAIDLILGFLGLALPVFGTFTQLTLLCLHDVRFHGPCQLGDLISSPRCPSLQKLSVHRARGVDNLTIHSESLLEVHLRYMNGLRGLTIIAPQLQQLKLFKCLAQDLPVANISAPQLVLLDWRDAYDPSSVQLGNLGQLQQLSTSFFIVYWQRDSAHNLGFRRMLQQFQFIRSLTIMLAYVPDIGNYSYLMEDIKMLPRTMFLTMIVMNEGHNFGPCSFHMLRFCTGIRRLLLLLCTSEAACQSGCICDQPTNWKTEELLLNCLEEVDITGLKGVDHEVVFVKRLFSWAPVLKKMKITLDCSISKGEARELLRTLTSFSRPETLLEVYMHHNAGTRSVFMLAPEEQGTAL